MAKKKKTGICSLCLKVEELDKCGLCDSCREEIGEGVEVPFVDVDDVDDEDDEVQDFDGEEWCAD